MLFDTAEQHLPQAVPLQRMTKAENSGFVQNRAPLCEDPQSTAAPQFQTDRLQTSGHCDGKRAKCNAPATALPAGSTADLGPGAGRTEQSWPPARPAGSRQPCGPKPIAVRALFFWFYTSSALVGCVSLSSPLPTANYIALVCCIHRRD